MPDPNCAKCGGCGWKVTEVDGLSGAERCQCFAAGRERLLMERAQIPPLYEKATLDNFKATHDPRFESRLRTIVNSLGKFIRESKVDSKPGLLFIGPCGSGKTHLAVAVLRALIQQRGFEGVFFDFQNLLERIRGGYDQASGTSDRAAYQTALETEFVVLDDLGARRVSDWVEDTVTSIITFRCNNRLPTIVTTNLRDPEAGDVRQSGIPGELQSKFFLEERIGTRARSRLFEMCRLISMPHVADYRAPRKETNQ